MAEVVAEPDRLDEVLVEPQRARHAAGDAGRLERVGQARAVVVAFGGDEDLGLVHEPAEGLGVNDAVAVALKGRAETAWRLGADASARLVRVDCEVGEGVLSRARIRASKASATASRRSSAGVWRAMVQG